MELMEAMAKFPDDCAKVGAGQQLDYGDPNVNEALTGLCIMANSAQIIYTTILTNASNRKVPIGPESFRTDL